MKKQLLLLLVALCGYTGLAQAPTITGDLMLCPNTNGTASIVTDQVYDSYTWYWKFWFTPDPYEAVPGEDGPSFTYDWYTYDQALIKVVVTLDGNTYESNVIQIDSYAWVGLTTGFENAPNISFDGNTGNLMLCEGTSFVLNVYNPYTIVQWYKDGEAMDGETNQQLHINQPGTYHVVAAPGFCPNSSSSSEGLPTVVVIDTNCDLGTNNPDNGLSLSVYPNPVKNQLSFASGEFTIDAIAIYNMAGQKVFSEKIAAGTTSIGISDLASGIYILEAQSGGLSKKMKIIKE